MAFLVLHLYGIRLKGVLTQNKCKDTHSGVGNDKGSDQGKVCRLNDSLFCF